MYFINDRTLAHNPMIACPHFAMHNEAIEISTPDIEHEVVRSAEKGDLRFTCRKMTFGSSERTSIQTQRAAGISHLAYLKSFRTSPVFRDIPDIPLPRLK
jgi:hypothetical protein